MSVDVDEALAAILLAETAVTNLVGQRVRPNRIVNRDDLEATGDCVIFRRINGGPMRLLDRSASGVKSATFQVESWSAVSQPRARTVDLAVQEADGTRGTYAGWFVQALRVNRDSDVDNPQIPINADEKGLFCSFCEMTLFYKPSIL